MSQSIEDRFWSKVDATGDCWEWMAGRDTSNHGKFWDGTRKVQAHRWAWEFLIGPVPDGLVLDHRCINPPCVNPAHLDPVTQAVNLSRSHNASAVWRERTHCKNNHEFTAENTRWYRGARVCRECQRISEANRPRRVRRDRQRPAPQPLPDVRGL